MISQSIFPGNEIKKGGYWDIGKYGKQIREMLKEDDVFE
jgi:hypothetical protein